MYDTLHAGSSMSSQLGRLMVDMLVESEQWVQDIMAFFSIFIKLKDATTSKAFKVYSGRDTLELIVLSLVERLSLSQR